MGDGHRCQGHRPSIQHQRPAQESANQHESGEQNEAHGGQLVRDGFHDIGGHQHLEAKQEGATDADLVDLGILIRYPM